MKKVDPQFEAALSSYCDFITENYTQFNKKNPGEFAATHENAGHKYIRIVTASYGSKSSHSFVVREDTGTFKKGDILKSAGWKAPAKNFIRGNIFDPKSYTARARWTGIQ